MAAPTIADLRSGLATNLGSIEDVQVSAYLLSSPTPPCIFLFPEEVDYDAAMQRGLDTYRFTVQAMTGLTSDIGAQKRLDGMLEPSGLASVKAAIESEPTLAGKCDDLRVVSASGYKVYQLPSSAPVLGCEWRVEIIAFGT